MKKSHLLGAVCASMISIFMADAANAVPVYADTVNSFSGGRGFGVLDRSGGTYSGLSGPGVFDPLAVTTLDGAALGLGGEFGPPGQIVLSFSTGSVIDGLGADIRVYDTIGTSEGVTLEASLDGLTFFSLGSFSGDSSTACSFAAPCASDFDIASTGLTSASYFRVTATQGHILDGGGCISNYPECYDLDALEALNFSAVPLPPALYLFGSGLFGLFGLTRWKTTWNIRTGSSL